MPYRGPLAETITQALRELSLADEYGVQVFRGLDPDDWRAEIKPIGPHARPFYLRFTLRDAPDWPALVEEG